MLPKQTTTNLKSIWENAYSAIAHSNQALDAIAELGEDNLLAEKGEALITRAYSHFVLVNVFCKHYDPATSSTDLGIPYMEKSETSLNPQYERGTVKEVYEKINTDIEAALPLISDDMYEIASYYFTQKAAYAFAARFNLYYEQWQKAVDYASEVISTNPTSSIRDWSELGSLPRDPDVVTNAYISDPANLLAIPTTSSLGIIFGAYYTGSRFNHSAAVASETLWAPTPWDYDDESGISTNNYLFRPFVYSGTNLDKSLLYKIPYMFEYTDPVAGIGYHKSVMIPFTTDETLLVRAEANTMLGNNTEALNDINDWTRNFYLGIAQDGEGNNSYYYAETTLEKVNELYNALPYASENTFSSKKKLNPAFTVQAGTQENLLHYVLQCRRVLTIHEGLRWFDIKRYGIEVVRYQLQPNGSLKTLDVLGTDDERRALQLPKDVISAGIEANPR